MVVTPNMQIDTSMIEEFSTPVGNINNKKKYMYVDENNEIVYRTIEDIIDDINEDGGIVGTNNKVVIRNWNPEKKYVEPENVIYNNGIWQCQVTEATIGEFIFDEWKLIAGYSKSSQFFYDAENEITQVVLEEEVPNKGAFLVNVNNLLLQSNNYTLENDGKTITFVNPVPADTQIEVIIYGNMIIPTNVDNIVSQSFTVQSAEESEFFVDDTFYKKELITVNVEGKILQNSEWEINPGRNGIILNEPVAKGTKVEISWFNNLDLSIGATFTPHVSKSGLCVTIYWTNDQGLENPETVEIWDGTTFTPHVSKSGLKTTLSWTNDKELPNPQTVFIFDGTTFTPTVSKVDYTTTISWSNDSGLDNPQTVQITDGVNYLPSSRRDDNITTISWSNDQGKVNPSSFDIYDGTTFTPSVSRDENVVTLHWENNGGLDNPEDMDIYDGATFTPSVSKSDYTTTLHWENNGGLENPSDVDILDGVIWTPHITSENYLDNRLSWTNNQGLENPDDVVIPGGATFTPHMTSVNAYTDTLSWTNDKGLENPSTINIVDGVNYVPSSSKAGLKTTIHWTNDQGKPNPSDAIISDGVTFTPHTSKTDYTTTLSWTNDDHRSNPDDVYILDGATYTPSMTRESYQVIVSWTNNQGLDNPRSAIINDGVNFVPSVSKSGLKMTISWSNDQGRPNPETVVLSDGATFTPHVDENTEQQTATIWWSNDDNRTNPDPLTLYIGQDNTTQRHVETFVAEEGQTRFMVSKPIVNKKVLSVNIDNEELLSQYYDLDDNHQTVILAEPAKEGEVVEIKYFHNLVLSETGTTFTPHITKTDYTTTISWTNDHGLPNPEDVEIYDGVIFRPVLTQSGLDTTISWTNNQGAENPDSVTIHNGATFTPHVNKTGYTTVISWTNNDNLPNPSNVSITDGVNYVPSVSKSGLKTTIHWTNDQGKTNPADAIISDGATFTPVAVKNDYTTTISWTNNDGLPNPTSVDILDGTIFTPHTSKSGLITTLSWTNNQGVENPSPSQINDGVTFTPHVTKDATTSTTTISWTNNGGLDNPETVQLLDGKVNDVLVDGTSVVTDRIAYLGSMAGETASDYVLQSAYDTKIAELEAADKTLQDNIDAEELRATTAEQAIADDLSDHIADKNNPHEVTKAQVGLGNVDNTSDLDKPISTATQTALDLKADKSDTYTKAEIDGKLSASMHFKGTVVNKDALDDITNPEIGDMYNVLDTGSNYAWDGTQWDKLSETIDLSDYATITYVDGQISSEATARQNADAQKVDKVTTASRVYGTDENGDQTTYDFNALGKVDDVKVNGTSVVTDKVANITLGTMATEDKDNYSTKAVADTLYADIAYEQTIDNHIADKNNPHEVTKEQVGLGNVDNTSDLDKPISTATQTALDNKVDEVTTANKVYGTDSTGNQTTYDVDSFGKVDDVKVGDTSVVTNKIAQLGTMASQNSTDYRTASAQDTIDATKVNNSDFNTFKNSLGTMSTQSADDYYTKIQADSEFADIAYEQTIDNHIADTSNPHQVTKAQVGLENVDNTSDLDKPISTATQTALDGKVSDVKVGNTSVVTDMVANLGSMASETASDYSTKAVADTLYADKTITESHIADTSNPHQVTKAQVGLGNVDNTSDLDKPISTATQTALDNKVDVSPLASVVYGTDSMTEATTYAVSDLMNKVIDVKVAGTSVVTDKVANLGSMASETASDYATVTALTEETTRATGVETDLQNSKADKATTYTKTEVDNMLSGAMHFKGTVATVDDLPSSDNKIGDMYHVTETGANYAWDGNQWIKMAENIDLSAYALTTYVDTQDQTKVDKVSTANKVYGTDSTGAQTTYDVDSFGQVDDVQVNGVSVVNNKVATLGTMADEDEDDWGVVFRDWSVA